MTWRAFLVDDEPLALSRLRRLLADTGRVEVAGEATDPVEAVAAIPAARPDLLFLDIHMPGLTGFDLLARLDPPPLVVFTTAHAEHALDAFAVHSLDYLLKPVTAAQLGRALNKLDRLRQPGAAPPLDIAALARQVAAALPATDYPERVASRLGDKIEFVDLSRVTHFYAQDKLTYAATATKQYVIDETITDLEARLDPRRFLRIHRAAIVQVSYIQELHSWFAGRVVLRLKDDARTELTVARDRVKVLKERMGV